MTKFHVNPKTGNSGECSATVQACPHGEKFHGDSLSEVAKIYEVRMKEELGGSIIKSIKKKFHKEKENKIPTASFPNTTKTPTPRPDLTNELYSVLPESSRIQEGSFARTTSGAVLDQTIYPKGLSFATDRPDGNMSLTYITRDDEDGPMSSYYAINAIYDKDGKELSWHAGSDTPIVMRTDDPNSLELAKLHASWEENPPKDNAWWRK